MGGIVKSVTKVFKSAAKVVSGVVGAVSGIANKAVSWLVPQPSVPDYGSFSSPENLESARGILINKSSNNAQIPLVYGQRELGVTRVYLETSGTDNQYLYMACVLCEGEIDSIQSIKVDDKTVTWTGSLTHGTVRDVSSGDSNFYKDSTSHIRVQAFLGLDNQVASSVLTTQSNWNSNYRLRGVAYLAFRFKWNQDVFGSIPDIKVTLKGRKVYDPRTATTAYSNNSALCLLDYLRNTRYGKGLPNSAFETNFQSFQDSADDCETQVTPYSGGSTIDLATTNAVLDTSQKVIDNVQKLLNPMRAIFSYNQGAYILKVEKAGTATKTITSDNVIGGIQIIGEKKSKKYNRIIGTFVNPSKNYQEDTVSFPPADDSGLPLAEQHATLLAEDNNVLLEGNFSFPCVTNPYQAEELCEIILKRSRNALAINVTLTSEFLDLAVGDIVNVTYNTASFSAKPFRVMGLTINIDSTVTVELIEHQNDFYDYSNKNQEPIIADTSLPNPTSIQPPASVTLTDDLVEYNDGTVITRLRVTIGASTDNFVDQYEVEVRQDTDRNGGAIVDNFRILGRGIALEYQMLNVIDNATYTVRVRGINAIGVKSTYVTAQRQIVGQTAVPSDVENFSINVIGDQALLSWSSIPDLDLDYYVIKFSTDLVTPTWQNSVDLIDRVARPATSVTVPLQTGSYLIKAQDKTGNQSSNETIITTNIATVNFVNQTTINEHTTFTGTKSGVSIETRDTTNYIGLTPTGTIGDTATRVPASGTYEFANTIDLGAKFKAQFTASISQFIEDVSEVFDNGRPDATTLFDDGRPNPFDGTSSGDAHTILQISTSDDNITYAPFTQFLVGEHIGRYFKFRVLFTSDNLKARSLISLLSVSASLAKRRESNNDIASGTGGKVITFDYAFKLNPAIGISAQDMDTGDYYTITSKSTSGFTIEFFDSSATSVNRTFDYIAEGVGQVII
jgi:hypothetical protein